MICHIATDVWKVCKCWCWRWYLICQTILSKFKSFPVIFPSFVLTFGRTWQFILNFAPFYSLALKIFKILQIISIIIQFTHFRIFYLFVIKSVSVETKGLSLALSHHSNLDDYWMCIVLAKLFWLNIYAEYN